MLVQSPHTNKKVSCELYCDYWHTISFPLSWPLDWHLLWHALLFPGRWGKQSRWNDNERNTEIKVQCIVEDSGCSLPPPIPLLYIYSSYFLHHTLLYLFVHFTLSTIVMQCYWFVGTVWFNKDSGERRVYRPHWCCFGGKVRERFAVQCGHSLKNTLVEVEKRGNALYYIPAAHLVVFLVSKENIRDPQYLLRSPSQDI